MPAETRRESALAISDCSAKDVAEVWRHHIEGNKENSFPDHKPDATAIGVTNVSSFRVKRYPAILGNKLPDAQNDAVDVCMLDLERVKLSVRFLMHNINFPFVGDQGPIGPFVEETNFLPLTPANLMARKLLAAIRHVWL